MDAGVHKHAEHEAWLVYKLETLPEDDLEQKNQLPPPTLFWVGAYTDWLNYPNGLADMAGYWAEMQLFGGVLLFDRGEGEDKVSLTPEYQRQGHLTIVKCNGVYIHNQKYTTLAPPTEAQFNNVIDFLLSESPDISHCPFPMEVTPDNKWRWDPYDARTKYHIFKHRHDIPKGSRPRRKDVVTPNTWPEIIDRNRLADEFEGAAPDKAARDVARIRIAMTISPNSRLWEAFREDIVRLQPDVKRQGRPPYFFD